MNHKHVFFLKILADAAKTERKPEFSAGAREEHAGASPRQNTWAVRDQEPEKASVPQPSHFISENLD